MARILVTQSDAFKARDPSAPYLAGSERRRDDDTQRGAGKLGLFAKGLGLAEGVVTSKALGALISGGARLFGSNEDGPVDRTELRKKAAGALMPKAGKPAGPSEEDWARAMDSVADPSTKKVSAQALMDDETAVLQDMGKRFSDEREGRTTRMFPEYSDKPPVRTAPTTREEITGRVGDVEGTTTYRDVPVAGKPRKLTTGELSEMREVSDREALLTGGEPTPGSRMAQVEAYVARAPTDDKMRLRQEYLRERLKAMVPDAPAEAPAPEAAPAPTPDATPAAVEAVAERRVTRDPGKIMAMAHAARTPEERAHVMELAASANVYPSTLADLATDAHMRKFQQELVKAFPKDDPLMALKAKNLEGMIEDRPLRREAAAKEAAARQSRFDVTAKQRVAEFEQRKKQHVDRIRAAYAQMANARNMQDKRLAEAAYQKGVDALEKDANDTAKEIKKLAEDARIPVATAPKLSLPAGVEEDAQAAKETVRLLEETRRRAYANETNPDGSIIIAPDEEEIKTARKDAERAAKVLATARANLQRQQAAATAKASKDDAKGAAARQALLPGDGLGDIMGGIGNTFEQVRKARERVLSIPELRTGGGR